MGRLIDVSTGILLRIVSVAIGNVPFLAARRAGRGRAGRGGAKGMDGMACNDGWDAYDVACDVLSCIGGWACRLLEG